MKRQFGWLWVVGLGVLLAGIAQADDPGGVVLTSKQIALTATAPKQNKTTGTWDTYLSLKNQTKAKLKQNFYGPFSLVVTSINRQEVTLANASGHTTSSGQPYLTISVPSEGLAAGKLIKRIRLEYNNPSNKKFKARYAVMGYLTPVVPPPPPTAGCDPAKAATVIIQSVIPNTGPTGTRVTINGSGFTKCSRVYLGEQAIAGPRFLSERQLEIIVPFALDAEKKLQPMPSGKYPVKVEQSSMLDFTVTDLPNNQEPPGPLIAEEASNIEHAFMGIQQYLDLHKVEWLEAYKDQPQAQLFLDKLVTLNQELALHLEGAFTEPLANLDDADLTLIARAMLAHQKTDSSAAPLAAQVHSVTTAASLDALTGDQWLQARSVFDRTELGRAGAVIADLADVCGQLLPITPNPQVGIFCALASISANLFKIDAEIAVAQTYGRITALQLSVTHETLANHVRPYFNNADNNETKPSANERKVTGARLSIELRPEFPQHLDAMQKLLRDTMGVVNELIQYQGGKYTWLVTAIDKLTELAAIKIDQFVSKPDFYKDITVGNVTRRLTDLFDAVNAGFLIDEDSGCTIPASTDEQFFVDRGAGVFVMPDKGPVVSKDTTLGECSYKVRKALRLPSEDGLSATMEIAIVRWPKATIKVGSGGKVKYPYSVPSGRDYCGEGQTCEDYFYATNGTDLVLEAQPNDAVRIDSIKWEGVDCKSGVAVCRLQLDESNRKPPVIVVSFNDIKEYLIGKWSSVRIDGPSKGEEHPIFTLHADGTAILEESLYPNSTWSFTGDSWSNVYVIVIQGPYIRDITARGAIFNGERVLDLTWKSIDYGDWYYFKR